ncbi:hypothetical protein DQ04_00181230 [Trypanosoma grayi]|uniref:hypothetical protein n=1 Tax=Trypanosoma grayi TaxID=71804 RepID=UPI0004F42612|nr:hypothetical protein DQ04_00181230 [Trypanosoma grayi]KEG15130.1 hypothetical protein DQ04_00181230 [Trypanosoma grayi]
MMQQRSSALRFLHVSRTSGVPFQCKHRYSSTLVNVPSHGAGAGLLASQQQPRPHSFCAMVADSFRSEAGKTLRHGVSEVVMPPIGTSQSFGLGIRCYEDADVLEKTEIWLRNLLKRCIETPSTELYESLVAATAEAYKISPSCHWRLHSRALANYGVQCFVDQKVARAVELLRQAVEVIVLFEGETATLHLRVMLANALACEGECFAALRQYECALAVMRDYPVETSLSQIVSGKEPRMPLSRSYVTEDFDRFIANEVVVSQAMSQGEQQLRSSEDNLEKVRITLAMARLQRRLGEKDASLPLYTSALRTLLDAPDVDMEIEVVHDIGLMLCFEAFDVAQGLPYLQAAAEMSLNRARGESEKIQRCTAPSARRDALPDGVLRIRHAAFALLDTAVCLAENDEVGKALGLFEESIAQMGECGMEKHSAWARMKFADALAAASLVDKAIRVYLEAMDTIRSIGCGEENLQVACMGMIVPLTLAEVEGRLAHCFQMHVGEYRRACVHFWQAIRRCGVYVGCPFRSAEETDVTLQEEVDSEMLCWMLENYASCCERTGNIEVAEEVLERCVSVEKSLGGSCVSVLLRLAQLQSATNATRALQLYIQLLGMPEDVLEPDALLQSAYGFADVCYTSKDEDMEAALAKAAVPEKSEASESAASVPAMTAANDTNAIIIESFKKAASVIMAAHAVDKVKSRASCDDELKALMTLSRGGFFCQRRGDERGAEELYRLAVEYTQLAHVTSEEYSRELAILLANYATVMVHKDTQKAEELYKQAVATCPTEENVCTAAASFFVLMANYTAGRACIQGMIDAATDRTTLPRLYGKLAWLGVVCWDELTSNLRHECLQHLLLALGLEPDNLLRIHTGARSNMLDEGSVSAEFKQKFLRGVTLSQDKDTVSLAGYIAQTKLPHEGRFINACYKAALARFPTSTTILVNYAKFCADYGAMALARKYYAAAFSWSHKDPRSSECYADYLAFLNGKDQQPQVVAGESLVRYQVERDAYEPCAPSQAQSLAVYGKYLATCMPSPVVPAESFEEAIRRNPADARATALYCSFLWNVCSRALDTKCAPEVKQQIAAKAEALYQNGLKHQPQSLLLLTALGALYVELGDRFEDAVRILEQARKQSPHNAAVNRLLCAAFHDEWAKESARLTVKPSARLQALQEATHQLYEGTAAMEPADRLTLTRYFQFAMHGLQNKELAARIMRLLHGLPKA